MSWLGSNHDKLAAPPSVFLYSVYFECSLSLSLSLSLSILTAIFQVNLS